MPASFLASSVIRLGVAAFLPFFSLAEKRDGASPNCKQLRESLQFAPMHIEARPAQAKDADLNFLAHYLSFFACPLLQQYRQWRFCLRDCCGCRL